MRIGIKISNSICASHLVPSKYRFPSSSKPQDSCLHGPLITSEPLWSLLLKQWKSRQCWCLQVHCIHRCIRDDVRAQIAQLALLALISVQARWTWCQACSPLVLLCTLDQPLLALIPASTQDAKRTSNWWYHTPELRRVRLCNNAW